MKKIKINGDGVWLIAAIVIMVFCIGLKINYCMKTGEPFMDDAVHVRIVK